jgi:hypothetical protein
MHFTAHETATRYNDMAADQNAPRHSDRVCELYGGPAVSRFDRDAGRGGDPEALRTGLTAGVPLGTEGGRFQ